VSAPAAWAELPELWGLGEAEEFFDALGVAYDPVVLASLRLRVMKRFGLSLAELRAAGLPEDAQARRAAIARALREAHDLVARNGAREGGLVAAALPVKLGLPKVRR